MRFDDEINTNSNFNFMEKIFTTFWWETALTAFGFGVSELLIMYRILGFLNSSILSRSIELWNLKESLVNLLLIHFIDSKFYSCGVTIISYCLCKWFLILMEL